MKNKGIFKHAYIWGAALCLLVAGCKNNTEKQEESTTDTAIVEQPVVTEPQNPAPGPQNAPILQDLPNIQNVEIKVVENTPETFVTVIVHGTMPYACSTPSEFKQSREGNNIKIDILSTRPADPNCPKLDIPFHHTIPVDVKGLKAGKYNVDVNNTKTGFTLKRNVPNK